MGARTLIDSALFASTDPVLLVGARCPQCSTVVFPSQDGCPRCSHRPLETMTLPERGVIWSWTIQKFEPKSPFRVAAQGWSPKAIGYVDLGEVIIEGWLTPADHDWRIGDDVTITTVPAWTEDDGTVVWTYAFELAAGRQS